MAAYLNEEIKIKKNQIADLGGLVKIITKTGISVGGGETYQITDAPDMSKVLYMSIMLRSSGNSSTGSDNFFIPNTGHSYLRGTSSGSGTYDGAYVAVNNNWQLIVSDYRWGGTEVVGYRIYYLDI